MKGIPYDYYYKFQDHIHIWGMTDGLRGNPYPPGINQCLAGSRMGGTFISMISPLVLHSWSWTYFESLVILSWTRIWAPNRCTWTRDFCYRSRGMNNAMFSTVLSPSVWMTGMSGNFCSMHCCSLLSILVEKSKLFLRWCESMHSFHRPKFISWKHK